jgi:hypothetical protein
LLKGCGLTDWKSCHVLKHEVKKELHQRKGYRNKFIEARETIARCFDCIFDYLIRLPNSVENIAPSERGELVGAVTSINFRQGVKARTWHKSSNPIQKLHDLEFLAVAYKQSGLSKLAKVRPGHSDACYADQRFRMPVSKSFLYNFAITDDFRNYQKSSWYGKKVRLKFPNTMVFQTVKHRRVEQGSC